MDNICNFVGSMGVGISHFLYDGRIHPYLASCGLGRDGDSNYSGAQARMKMRCHEYLL